MPKRRRNHGNRKPRKQPKDSVDRISNLPVEIIREIQSYLPRKDSVKTSILSKKWRSIWASHPKICLDEMDFGADYSEYSVTDKAKRDAFLTYLIKSLESRERPCEYNCPVDKLFLRMTVGNSSAKMLEVIIPVEVTDILPVNGIKHLELEITTRYGTFDEVADDFTWIFPDLKTLSLTLGSTTKLIAWIFPDLKTLSLTLGSTTKLIEFE